MNTLSWLIYAAEVAENLRQVCIGVAILSAIAIPVGMLVGAMMTDVHGAPTGTWKRPLRLLLVPIVCAILASITPSTNTIYMIAASEVGETIVTSPDAIEMMGDLKAIIKQRLKAELPSSVAQ